MCFGGSIQTVVEAAHPTVVYAHTGNLLWVVEVADVFLQDTEFGYILRFFRHDDGERLGVVIGLRVIADLATGGERRLVVSHLRTQLCGINVVEFTKGVQQQSGISADNVQRVTVVTYKAKHGIKLTIGHILVFADSSQVTQILQRQQYQMIVGFGFQFSVLLHPLGSKAHILAGIACGILLTVGAVFQLRHEIFKFYTRIPFLCSLFVNDGDSHFSCWY